MRNTAKNGRRAKLIKSLTDGLTRNTIITGSIMGQPAGETVMGFGAKAENIGVDANRLAALAGKPIALPVHDAPSHEAPSPSSPSQASTTMTAAERRVSLEPDTSRIRKCSIDETPAQRQKRLAAKTANFSATIMARIIILAAVGYYAWVEFNGIGGIHRGVVIGFFVMLADLGRVILKALDPGSR